MSFKKENNRNTYTLNSHKHKCSNNILVKIGEELNGM